MSIRKGLRYGDDEPDPHIIEKTSNSVMNSRI